MKNYRDLQRLKGVGRVSSQALAAAGFTSLVEVADAAPGELASSLSTVKSPVSPRATDLIKQANALVNGQAYAALADRTKGRETTNGQTTAVDSGGSRALARLLVKNIGPGLLKAPAFRTALIKRAIKHPPTRARIIRRVVDDLG